MVSDISGSERSRAGRTSGAAESGSGEYGAMPVRRGGTKLKKHHPVIHYIAGEGGSSSAGNVNFRRAAASLTDRPEFRLTSGVRRGIIEHDRLRVCQRQDLCLKGLRLRGTAGEDPVREH